MVSLFHDGPAKATPFKIHFDAGCNISEIEDMQQIKESSRCLRERTTFARIFTRDGRHWGQPETPGEFGIVMDCRYASSQVQPTVRFVPLLNLALRHLKEGGWLGRKSRN